MNGWKITAIIFLVLFILESICFVGLYFWGTEMINRENKCRYDVCFDYDAFYYDDWIKMCYCYEDDEIVVEKYIR